MVSVANLWVDVCTAIENKQCDPVKFNRIYIGSVHSSISTPVHVRKYQIQHNSTGLLGHFLLTDPLDGIFLTRREVQVLYLICKGNTNREVAERIGLSSRTIEYYIKNMRKKTFALSKVHLVQQILKTDFLSRVDKSVLD